MVKLQKNGSLCICHRPSLFSYVLELEVGGDTTTPPPPISKDIVLLFYIDYY